MTGYQTETTIRWGGRRPEIVCLCGSTRFKNEILAEAAQLSLAGLIVVGPFVFGHADMPDIDWTTDGNDTKRMLDELHFRKIELADRIVVVDPGGYIGESTGREITYAWSLGKRIDFTEPSTWPDRSTSRPEGTARGMHNLPGMHG